MKNNLLLKIIAVVIVLIGVGFGIYKSVTKEKDLVFEATIKDVVSRDNKYTILVEKKDKDNVIEYEFEIDNKTKIISAISCMTPSVSKIKITPSF